MKQRYRRRIAPSLERELVRLKDGNDAEKQRYKNVLPAMAKVESNPVNKDFNKILPQGYKAVDVLQQYRLFFRLVHPPESSTPTIYYSWINDEDSIHRSGKPDDSYAIFRKKLEGGEIEPFTEEQEPEELFTLSERWGAQFIYASYICRVASREDSAHTGLLALHAITDFDYRILHINETTPDRDLATKLLDRLADAADERKVTLRYSIALRSSSSVEWERSLLSVHNFHISEESGEDEEIWIRPPNHNH